MASDGDTITYTFENNQGDNGRLLPQEEDISSVNRATVEYCDGAGGANGITDAGAGGRVENVVIDLSGQDKLYIWVAGSGGLGRYEGYSGTDGFAGGSTEIAFTNTDGSDSTDEPFLVGAGGGGGGYDEFSFGGSTLKEYPAGARGGDPNPDGDSAEGSPPPLGGDAPDSSSDTGGNGDGAVDDNNRGYILDSGTTIAGGGSAAGNRGEIQITYKQVAPPVPTNIQIIDAQTQGELTVDWDESGAAGYYVYRAEASGTSQSDYTQVADVAGPPYTDTGLEDGERYYYRVSSHD